MHKDDDPFEVAGSFCKVYGLKDEIKQRLAESMLKLMNKYLLDKSKKQEEVMNTMTNKNYTNFSNNLNLDDL